MTITEDVAEANTNAVPTPTDNLNDQMIERLNGHDGEYGKPML